MDMGSGGVNSVNVATVCWLDGEIDVGNITETNVM